MMGDRAAPNEIFRTYTTSVGFALTLTKLQIDLLILYHHFKGFDGAHRLVSSDDNGAIAYRRSEIRAQTRTLSSHWISTSASLDGRGLTTPNHKLTKAGRLVVALLKEAGIYQERLEMLGVVKAVA
jgi:hypothetical protein